MNLIWGEFVDDGKGGIKMVLSLSKLQKDLVNLLLSINYPLIPEKEMFGFLGANGAGKTTTFRMILGLLNPSSGKITWDR